MDCSAAAASEPFLAIRLFSAALKLVGGAARMVDRVPPALETREAAVAVGEVESESLLIIAPGRLRSSVVEAELGLRGNGFSVDDEGRGAVEAVPASIEASEDLGRVTRDKRAVTVETRLSLAALPPALEVEVLASSFSLPPVNDDDGLAEEAPLFDALRCTDCTTALRMSVTLDPNPPRVDPAVDGTED